MTATYLGSSDWELKFDSRKRVVLSENEMQQIVEQYEAMVYRDCHDDVEVETEDERRFRESITRGQV